MDTQTINPLFADFKTNLPAFSENSQKSQISFLSDEKESKKNELNTCISLREDVFVKDSVQGMTLKF